MDKYDEHFLDSNIIIGSILKWNKPHQTSYAYFKKTIIRILVKGFMVNVEKFL